MSSGRRSAVLIGAVLALLLVVVAAVAISRSGTSDGAGPTPTTEAAAPGRAGGSVQPGQPITTLGSDGSSTVVSSPADATTAPTAPTASSVPGDDAAPTTAPRPEPTAAPDVPRTPVSLPVAVTVSASSGLRDGQTVNIHAVPTGGSQVFGVEARICAAGRTIDFDADFRPTQTGNCIVNPLSATSDAHLTVAAAPPYQSVDVAFRVGTGTSRYTTQSGEPVAITCGPGNPCQLVLKLQIPNGFGFQAYPLNYG